MIRRRDESPLTLRHFDKLSAGKLRASAGMTGRRKAGMTYK
jgi:hypothetical protein